MRLARLLCETNNLIWKCLSLNFILVARKYVFMHVEVVMKLNEGCFPVLLVSTAFCVRSRFDINTVPSQCNNFFSSPF